MNYDLRGFERMLVATDFSASADAALRQAAWLAHRNGAHITLAHALPDLQGILNASSLGARLDVAYGKGELFLREARQESEQRLSQAIAALNANEERHSWGYQEPRPRAFDSALRERLHLHDGELRGRFTVQGVRRCARA